MNHWFIRYLNNYFVKGCFFAETPLDKSRLNNRSELNRAFSNISEEITSGLSSGKVHDSLPTGVTSTAIPSGTVEWDLKDFEKDEEKVGDTTTYTYTKTYTVKIDPTDEAVAGKDYYPLNGPTTLTVKDSNGQNVTIDFPIPAGKVVMPTHTVTWKDYDGKILKSEDFEHGTSADVVEENEPQAPSRPEDDEYTYTFTGWMPANYDDVTGPQTYTATYSEEARSYTVSYQYDDTAPADAPDLPADESHQYKTEVTVKDKPILDGYRFSGWTTSDADVSGNSFTMPAKNVTFTGSWEATEFLLTINYVYAGGGEAAKPHTEKVQCNTTYSVTSPVLDGYTADTPVVSGTMPAQPVTVTVTYTKRSDLSYTVNYYWNGTTDKAAESKTVENQTFGTDVTESPIAIEGYTPVSNDSKAITIGTDSNVITFYYYKNVKLTANSKTEPYDGTEKSVSGFTGAPDGADFSAITVGAKGTTAGNYPAEFTENTVGTVDKNGKYIVEEYKNGMLTISSIADKVTVTITGHTDSAIYDGKEKSVTGYDVASSNALYTTDDFTFSGTAEAKGTDADTYPMNLKAEQFTNTNTNFTNVEFVVTDGELTITKRDVTLTSADASKPYDGTALTNKNVTVGGNGFADGEGATYNVTGSQTEVGESANAFTYTLNNNTKESNYNITKHEGKLKITAADSVAYKVEHYKQNLDGSYNNTPNDIDPLSGTAGTLTAAAAKDYPGFTPGTVTQEKIKSDGTTTIKIQYTRNSYTLTINYVYRDGSKAAESHIGTILYGKDYSVTSPKISGYTADKLVVSGTMPADNRTVTVTYTKNGGHHPRPKPTVEIEDDDALGLNTTDHFAYIVGYGNGEVRPQNNITRAEVATIFFRLLTDDVRDENLTKTNRYSDVAATSWYNTAVSTLSSMGIITGYPDGTFRPNAAITRAEFAAIAARFDSNGDKTTAKFSDIATHWAKDEISIAYNNGWINGYPNGTFGPQRDITRAETMTLVNRVLNRQPETEEDLLPNMVTWTDNADKNAWYYLAVQEATNSHYYKFKTNSKYEKWTELRETRDWTQLEK